VPPTLPARAGPRGPADHQPQVAGRALQTRGDGGPVGQAARELQAGGQHVAAEVQQLAGGDLVAQELHAGLIELVGLVEDRHPHRRQQFRHTRFAHRQVGKEQVVVDHDHVGGQRLAPRPVDVAGMELGALRAQAVVAR
jgi:hypothetical protein